MIRVAGIVIMVAAGAAGLTLLGKSVNIVGVFVVVATLALILATWKKKSAE